jgi:vanillate O-demethylase monooxygenase subunit
VENPHGRRVIPGRARVRSYPVIERYGAIWLWMGEQPADAAAIPDFSGFDRESAFVGQRYLYAKANYQLDVDNILDLSHIQYLHRATLGSSDVSAASIEVVQDGNTVHSRRLVTNEQLTPFLESAFFVAPGQRVDRELDVRWDPPASMLLTVTVTPTGRPAGEGHVRRIAHLFSPETDTTTHYWFALAYPRSMGPHAEELAENGVAGLVTPFETEDLPMLEAQQVVIGDREFMGMRPLILESDAGATRARRILNRMIATEQRALAVCGDESSPARAVESSTPQPRAIEP